jgi:hypothetical protein
LSRRRTAGLAAVLAALIVWDAWAGVLPNVGLWPDVLIAAFIVLPVTFAVPWLVLPYAPNRAVAVFAVIFVALSVLFYVAGIGSLFNVSKLLALTAIGFLFVQAFEALSWVVLIAFIIPWVDALSVWRGPTSYVVSEQPSLFERISIAFRLPGENGSANIGPPDILFFALFLAATVRWQLRPGWTWLAMTGMYSLTLVLANATDVSGLPALPFLSFGFLLANCDLLWRRLRPRRT